MFKIKVCGITRVEDAITAAKAGVDAIGLNFFELSPRCVRSDRATEIVKSLPPGVAKVGVFVNHPLDEVARTLDQLQLDFAQLHGDETPEFVAKLAPRLVIRAWRGFESLTTVDHFVDRCAALHGRLAALLIDAHVPGQYGGTGVSVEWHEVRRWSAEGAQIPIVLAGGLRPENVAAAIQAAAPDAVDTASGVESEPGIKDARLVEQFAENARHAFFDLEA